MPKALYANDPAAGEGLGVGLVERTVAQLNNALNPASRIVLTTATALSLTAALHAERILLIETNSTVANTFTLPEATGSGDKYTLVNGIAQTQGSIVIAALTTDVFNGRAKAFDTTAQADAGVFLSTATSDKITFNLTTTGGLGYDTVVAIDKADGEWLIDCEFSGSGTLATPFAAS